MGLTNISFSRMRHRWAPKPQVIVAWVILAFFALLLSIGIICIYRFIRITGLSPGAVVAILRDSQSLLVSSGDRTNVLLLGMSGGDHEGSMLTDSILVMSLDSSKRSLSLLAVPRDIWSDSLKDKINSAYYYGEIKKSGGGITLSKAIIEEVTGLPIHYAVVVDFTNFVKVVDMIGGIDVLVSHAFTDQNYPITGKENDLCNNDQEYRCRYETVSFIEGQQHMGGMQALKYVRSRQATGEEGTDFARGRRQQEVIVGLKNKFISPMTWIKLIQDNALVSALGQLIDSDMNMSEFVAFGKYILVTRGSTISPISIESLLYSPSPLGYNGRYVLVPVDDLATIHANIQAMLATASASD